MDEQNQDTPQTFDPILENRINSDPLPPIPPEHLVTSNSGIVQPMNDMPMDPPTMPPVAQPPVVESAPQPEVQDEVKTKRSMPKKLVLGLIGAVVILLLSATVLYAYGVIPAVNNDFQDKVAYVVMSIPFTPKTATYVVEAAGMSYNNVHSLSYNINLNADLTNLDAGAYSSFFTLGKINANLVGGIDETDVKNPALTSALTFTGGTKLNLTLVNKKLYFNIVSIPTSLTTSLTNLGITQASINKILNQWYFTDASSQTTSNSSTTDIQTYVNYSHNADVLKSLTMTTTNLNGESVYDVKFAPTSDTLDKLQTTNTSTKLSDSVSDVVIEGWINESNYNIDKITMSFNSLVKPSTITTTTSKIPVSLSLQFSNLNGMLNISAPAGAKSVTDLTNTVLGLNTTGLLTQ